jgi:hypothetical protein
VHRTLREQSMESSRFRRQVKAAQESVWGSAAHCGIPVFYLLALVPNKQSWQTDDCWGELVTCATVVPLSTHLVLKWRASMRASFWSRIFFFAALSAADVAASLNAMNCATATWSMSLTTCTLTSLERVHL